MFEAIGAVAGIATLIFLFRPLFGDGEGFLECVRFWIRPDIFSWVRGEGLDDWWAEMKLGAWLVIAVFVGVSVYGGLTAAFG